MLHPKYQLSKELGLLWRAFETKGAAPQDPEVLEQRLCRTVSV